MEFLRLYCSLKSPFLYKIKLMGMDCEPPNKARIHEHSLLLALLEILTVQR
jgi:hypothetical protein